MNLIALLRSISYSLVESGLKADIGSTTGSLTGSDFSSGASSSGYSSGVSSTGYGYYPQKKRFVHFPAEYQTALKMSRSFAHHQLHNVEERRAMSFAHHSRPLGGKN